jgi:predicted nucleotidyltransferase
MAQAQPPQALDLEHLRSLAEIVARASGAVKVVLFGSRARGQARADSDLDWLLVIPDKRFGESFTEQVQPALRASQALLDRGLYTCAMDFVPTRASTFNEGKTVIARAAAKDGIVLYG